MSTRPFLLLLPVLALAAGCRSADPAGVPDPRVSGESIEFARGAPQLAYLETGTATAGRAPGTRLSGHLAWDEDATTRVFTPFAGRVRQVLVDAGRGVAKGEPLAEVESPDFAQAQADARTAESDLRLADRNLARLRELFDHGAAARKDVDAADAERARAAAARAHAQDVLAACGASADTVDGVFLLRSPIAGTVVERNLTPGQEIRPDQMLANEPRLSSPLFVLSDPTRLWLEIDATASELGALRPGAPFRFTCDAAPGRTFAGRVALVGEAVDPDTHALRARAEVANPERLLKAQMLVDVEVPGARTSCACVPAGAVFLRGERHYVFVEGPSGCFTRREVVLGAETGTEVLIARGLQPGDRVVTGGSLLLAELLD